MSDHAPSPVPRVLITAGPTHEPIDAVRYIGNRSSGRLGIALANEAASRGWATTLLLGPTPSECSNTQVTTIRFASTADLEALLAEHAPHCDCLIMAAAVSDYRPAAPAPAGQKLRRSSDGLTLELEPTPDLLAGVASSREPGQLLVGFALEPRDRLIASAESKLARKGIDCIVANPLETMDASSIEATLISTQGDRESTDGPIPKPDFARWLLDRLVQRLSGSRTP